jgi:hypothetical protein
MWKEGMKQLCEFYLHNLVLPHPYRWSSNPYVRDVQFRAFFSWVYNEEERDT